MASFDLYFPKEILYEGAGYENDGNDECTAFGIVVSDLQEYHLDLNNDGIYDCEDLRRLTREDAGKVLKKLYWDFFKADNINNQSIGEFFTDTALNQGRILAVKYVQLVLGLTADGIVGSVTLNAINNANQPKLFQDVYNKRKARYDAIVKSNPKKQEYYNGWLHRLNAIKYLP